MANPQKENGYTEIANEIMEAMSKINWSSYEIRVLIIILRKTYGWHKKEDWISLSQISNISNILPQHISRTISKLIKRNILRKNKKKIGLNKNYELWDGGLPNEVIPNEVGGVTQPGIKNIPIQVTTKESKETIQKKDVSFKGKKYVNIDWEHPYTKARNKLGRYYLFRGKDKMIYAQLKDGSFIRKLELFKKHGK